MPRKQTVIAEPAAAGAALARVAKPAATRTRTAKHSKAVSVPETIATPVEEKDPIEIISGLAYGYWEARNGEGGSALEDWTRAEAEYRSSLGL